MNRDWGFLELQSEQERENFAAESLAVSIQLAIQRVMMRNGVSQKQLAERLGVSAARVSQILSAHGRNLTLGTLGRIAHALEEDFEFVAVNDLRDLKSKAKAREKTVDSALVRDVGDLAQSPWTDVSANENRFPQKQAA
jgi:transcriptional regulator with XRE-family HTH domain